MLRALVVSASIALIIRFVAHGALERFAHLERMLQQDVTLHVPPCVSSAVAVFAVLAVDRSNFFLALLFCRCWLSFWLRCNFVFL